MICEHLAQIDIRKLVKKVGSIPAAFDFEGEWVATTWEETAFGGRRQWFLCPSCERRCAIIYRRGSGPLWGCRICMNGRYTSERMSPNDRKLHKAIKLRTRLGQRSGGIIAPFPPKPKGMHWKTYLALREEAEMREKEILLKAWGDKFGSKFEPTMKCAACPGKPCMRWCQDCRRFAP